VRSSLAASLVFATACHAGQIGPVFLSQVCVVVDAETYRAIAHSTDIRVLASARERTADSGRGGWTAFVIAGRQTAIEILSPVSGFDGVPLRPGQSEIILGFADAGTAAWVMKGLLAAFALEAGTVVQNGPSGTLSEPVEVGLRRPPSHVLSAWFVQATPGFLLARYPGPAQMTHRSQLLRSDFRPEQTFDDVVGLTVNLDDLEATAVIKQLKAGGWEARPKGGDTTVKGPDVSVDIVPSAGPEGVAAIEFRLRHPAVRRETLLGHALLQVEGERGRLRFLAKS
jgi:hypothetical protein